MSATIGIGSTVWIFAANGRAYRTRVTAEGLIHWTLADGSRISMTDGDVREGITGCGQRLQVVTTYEAMDSMMWVEHDAPALAEAVHQCRDPEVLRRIAKLLDYVPQARP